MSADRGQSEVLSSVLVVATVVVLVSVVAAYWLPTIGAERGPLADVEVTVTDSRLAFTHAGGESLGGTDLRVVLRHGGATDEFDFDAAGAYGPDGTFDPGERWVDDSPPFAPGETVEVLLVHDPTGTVLFEGRRVAAPPTPTVTPAPAPVTPTVTSTPTATPSTPTPSPTPTPTPDDPPRVDSLTATSPGGSSKVVVDWEVSDDVQLDRVTVTVTRDSDGAQVGSETWNVGGTSATGSREFTGLDPGDYTVTVTVRDTAGQTNQSSTDATVSASGGGPPGGGGGPPPGRGPG